MKKIILLASLALLPFQGNAAYYSQVKQDATVYNNYFYEQTGLTFVDIGAHNGVTFSNSCFFERERGWTGICVEPIPEVFAELQKNRSAILVNGCVTDFTGKGKFLRVKGPGEMLSGLIDKYDPRHLERIKKTIRYLGGSYSVIDVQCYLLEDLLEQHGIDHIHFLSIDTEGGELDILKTIDFDRIQIDVITVEDNYSSTEFEEFLVPKGFNYIGRLAHDKLFVNQQFQPRAQL